MRALLLLTFVIALGSCEQLPTPQEAASRALAALCTSPPDQLAVLFPDTAHQTALRFLCAVLNLNPRVGG